MSTTCRGGISAARCHRLPVPAGISAAAAPPPAQDPPVRSGCPVGAGPARPLADDMIAELAAILSTRSGVALALAIAADPLPVRGLSRQEAHAYARLVDERRQLDWLRGRNALRQVMRHTAAALDAGAVSFPHPRLSLSHCSEQAVAVCLLDRQVEGTGIDMETNRQPRPESLRFYLRDYERSWLDSLEEEARQRDALRLWTVKEAVFKADLENDGQILHDYRLADPAMATGTASHARRQATLIWYTSVELAGGFLSLALRIKE